MCIVKEKFLLLPTSSYRLAFTLIYCPEACELSVTISSFFFLSINKAVLRGQTGWIIARTMTLFLTAPCCKPKPVKLNLKCSVFLQLLDLTCFSFRFGMNYPAYSTILKGLGLINACRSTTGQYLIPTPFKCRPYVTKSIGPLSALISLHLTSLTLILLLWDFLNLWKKTNIVGLPPQWWSRRRAHGGNFSPNPLLRAVHPWLCRHCKQPVCLRKVLVLNLSGSWSPTEHWRAHVAALEQFRPGQTPYRITVCWKPMHSPPHIHRLLHLPQSLNLHLRPIHSWCEQSLTFVTITQRNTDETPNYICFRLLYQHEPK